ncbi:MAG: restriction endonuclease, partial [Oscillochloris sp.]|nr:restriction endonuclease [Oscillochloris sp.]
MTTPPLQPDLRRQLRARLMALSPRAFELFAGDLLTYIGLQHVAVTRYRGDGGVDAHGDLLTDSGLVCVPTGVQVKRHRQNVQRPDIDRFIGAIGGQYRHGIFITTAGYAEQARIKARTSSVLRIDTITGDDVVTLMRRHQLGLQAGDTTSRLDEDYFLGFEAQADTRRQLREEPIDYVAGQDSIVSADVCPEDDLISLRALGYALRIDAQTVRDWIDRGQLQPDHTALNGRHASYFFRRDRSEAIRQQLKGATLPQTSAQWRQEFLDFVSSRNLTKSYKPVMLKAILKLVSRNGEVQLDDLAAEFQAFYIQRQCADLPIEFGVPLLENPAGVEIEAIKRLIIKHPLERFIIKGFLSYNAATGIIHFAPQLWGELRFYELLDIQRNLD